MIHKLSDILAVTICKKGIFPQEETEIYSYGFELLISGIISFIIILVCGIVFGILSESILFYIIFVGVRPFSGGYHAETHFKCKVTFLSMYAMIMSFSSILTINYNPSYHFLLILICMLSMYLYAPVEHPNKPLEETERQRNRKLSLILSSIVSLVSIAVALYSLKHGVIIILALFSVSILMFIAKAKEGEG